MDWGSIVAIVVSVGAVATKWIDYMRKNREDTIRIGTETNRMAVEAMREVFAHNRMERGTSVLPLEYWIVVASQARLLFESAKSDRAFNKATEKLRYRMEKLKTTFGKRWMLLEERQNEGEGK